MSNPSVLPTGPGRLEALEAVWTLFLNDAAAQVDTMVAEGWPPDLAASAVRSTYLDYVTEKMRDAIEMGVELYEVTS